MSGKAYTMLEMKGIVEYVKEHKAYGEIKGRKMWMEFANSKATNRTWQSLKETFLKRILPDIQNPYYKLTMHQISSFRQGYDVEKRLKQTLEIREASDEAAEIDEKKTNEISTDNENNKNNKGEIHKNSKVDSDIRDSTETLVLDTCYETPEEIQRDLTSPLEKEKDSATKKLRDLIEFEPTSSDVQKLVEEFVTEDESSDREPQMEIDLGDNGQNCENVEGLPISISDSEEINVSNTKTGEIQNNNKSSNICPNEKKALLITEEKTKVYNSDTGTKENQNKEKEEKVISSMETDEVEKKTKDILNTSDKNTPIQSSITDSLLPNNQEELKNDIYKTKKSSSLSLKKYTDNVCDMKKLQKEIRKKTPPIENPCLKSVSLFDEQHSNVKTSDTEKDIKDSKKKDASPQPETAKNREIKTNEILVLKSHSETISSDSDERANQRPRPRVGQQLRDKALANVFGFTSGAGHRRRKSNYRKQSISQRGIADDSLESSEWMSESGSEFVSPPRGRKNRQTRRYLKPRAARVFSLERNGGLFVINNKKVYPLVKDGRIVKNYVTYISDDESEEEKQHWKQKYLEQKKRTAELEGLLNQIKQKEMSRVPEPPACTAGCNAARETRIAPSVQDTRDKEEKLGKSCLDAQDEKPVKIKFVKNNQEVQLEGAWTKLNPVLAEVMRLFQKEPELSARPQRSASPAQQQPESEPRVEPTTIQEVDVLSDSSTPVTVEPTPDEVKKKIDEIENEILKEIEEKDRQENGESEQVKENVTMRNTRTRKASKDISKPPIKKPKLVESATEEKHEDKRSSGELDVNSSVRQTRNKSKVIATVKDTSETKTSSTRRTSKRLNASVEPQTGDGKGDGDVRYKFPSTSPARSNKKTQPKKLTIYDTSSTTMLSPNNPSPTESVQGYQDSDVTPTIICVNRRKHSTSSSTYNNKNESPSKPNKLFLSVDDGTNESSNSYQHGSLQTLTFHNSTISTEIYRTDSYQLLMHQNIEGSKKNKSINIEVRNIKTNNNNVGEHTDEYSSSNVSVPTSPVLSIVENLSINKSFLSSIDELAVDAFNKQEIYSAKNIMLNDLMKTGPNVPMPLMEQDCKIEAGCEDGNKYHYNINSQNTLTPSKTLISKFCTVDLEDIALSDSFNHKFKDLLLDSRKKTKVKVQKNGVHKSKSKKRSSTPRKRQTSRNLKLINEEPYIEEEQMETYSCAARRSCPPVLQINNFTEEIAININNKITDTDNSPKNKDRKKKNIIKVKITKPKEKGNVTKSIDQCNNTALAGNSKNDSESGVFLHDTNNSIDLIHNHSETCLQAHECIGDSVEFVENSNVIITVDSNSETLKDRKPFSLLNINDQLAHDMYSSDAQDATEMNRDLECMYPLEIDCTTLFHTPMTSLSSATSLITEDLSIEEETPSRNTNWFLFSEDENTNTNFVDRNKNSIKDRSYGAYLNDIFPITCAIPDLSTITEQSKENDIETRSNLNSPFCN